MWRNSPLYIIRGDVKWFSHCGKQLSVSSKLQHKITIRPNSSTARYTSERTENRDSNKYMHSRVYSSTIHNRQKVWKWLQVHPQTNGQIVVQSHIGLLLTNKKEWITDTCYTTWIELERSQTQKENITCFHLFHLYEISWIGTSTEKACRLVVAGARVGGWGNGE